MTREQWLNKLVGRLNTHFFKPAIREGDYPKGLTLPKMRITCGWPGVRAMSGRIGECWPDALSGDGTHELIVSMRLDDPLIIAGVTAHEMVHAIIGCGKGHGPAFRQLALAVGLEGRMTATVTGERFNEKVAGILKALGPYPHARVAGINHKKQSTRLVKCECKKCYYITRTSSKWIVNVGAPHCPDHGEMEVMS